mmetsp:Transcript_155275/g.498180  ORF Transcript_155275/g.498180 Transcript_155275/m.498180 type:complete len:257 (-) Transcript_155275:527-1297(-)
MRDPCRPGHRVFCRDVLRRRSGPEARLRGGLPSSLRAARWARGCGGPPLRCRGGLPRLPHGTPRALDRARPARDVAGEGGLDSAAGGGGSPVSRLARPSAGERHRELLAGPQTCLLGQQPSGVLQLAPLGPQPAGRQCGWDALTRVSQVDFGVRSRRRRLGPARAAWRPTGLGLPSGAGRPPPSALRARWCGRGRRTGRGPARVGEQPCHRTLRAAEHETPRERHCRRRSSGPRPRWTGRTAGLRGAAHRATRHPR